MHHAQYYIGATLAHLGEHQQAMHWLRRAADDGYPSYPRFSGDENLSSLKGVGGFESLLARLRQQHDHWKSLR